MNKKPYYITTAIAYTSSKPHIGNTYEIILADAIARFKRLQGYDVFFQTGTDEHGQKIEEKAIKNGLEPKEYVDIVAKNIKSLWDEANISYDKFIRTTDDYHEKQVQKMFKKLYEQGDIYLGSYEGLYCTPCESFWTESQLKDGRCPDCGGEVKKAKEEAYFFKMSKYADRLVEYYNSHENFVMPQNRKTEMINNFIKNGLQDLCVSRTSFKWGIPVDFDTKHVVYVWLDALTNYITGIGYNQDGESEENFKKYWPADLQVIGKDIVRFHIIYWPIILMALNLPLPKQIYGHGWLLQNGEKMSKSKGNVLYFDDLASVFGVDAVRYYVLSEMGYADDGLIGWDKLTEKINSDLANVYGNLVSRTIAMAKKYFDGKIEQADCENQIDEELKNVTISAYEKVCKKFDELKISDALGEVFAIFKRANKYIDENEPWVLAKNGQNKRLNVVLYNLLESLVIGTSLLQPFMPKTCEKVFEFLGTSAREFSSMQEFGVEKEFNLTENVSVLFPRLDILQINAKAEEIRQNQLKENKIMEENEKKEKNDLVNGDEKSCDQKEKNIKSESENILETKNDKPEIEFSDFEKIELKVGTIIASEKVENAEKLLKFTVKLGDEERTIVSGVYPHYNPEYMLNKQVVVVTNLKPRKIRGIESKGMILYAENEQNEQLFFITPEKEIESGSEVC